MKSNIVDLNSQVVALRNMLAEKETALRRLYEASKQVETERDAAEAARAMVTRVAIAMMLEHHEGKLELTVALINELEKPECNFQLASRTSLDGRTVSLTVTDDKGNTVEADKRQGAIAIAKTAPPAEVEHEKAARCPECFLAFGEHRPGCEHAEQKSLPLQASNAQSNERESV